MGITHVEDDFELNLRRILAGAETWEMVGDKVRARVRAFLNAPSAVQYRIGFDDSRYVPPNKGVEQQARDASSSSSYGTAPFTPQEQRHIIVGVTPVPAPSQVFFQRLMATRAMRPMMRAFVVTELSKLRLAGNKTLVVDGGVPSGVVAYAATPGARIKLVASPGNADELDREHAADEPVEEECDPYAFEFASDPDNDDAPTVSAVMARPESPAPQLDIDAPTTITITPHGDGAMGNNVHISPVPRIAGEGDFKIPDGIAMMPRGSVVFVRSCDTDMIPILLMQMRRLIDDDTQSLRYTIYIDTNGAIRDSSKERPILNVTQLWREVMRTFICNFPWARHPIETFATVMLLTGSDYLKTVVRDPETRAEKLSMGLPQIGPAAVWSAFCSLQGRAILFPDGMEDSPPVIVDAVHGDTAERIAIGIDERRWGRFIAFMYHRKIYGASKAVATNGEYSLNSVRDARKRIYDDAVTAALGDPTKVRPAAKWRPPSSAKVCAFVRQMSWGLAYLINGASAYPFPDPFETVLGYSLYGWIRDPETQRVGLTTVIHMRG